MRHVFVALLLFILLVENAKQKDMISALQKRLDAIESQPKPEATHD